MLKALLFALILTFSAPQTETEYRLITKIQPYSEEIDIVTVSDANGNESQFYADTHAFMGGSYAKVTADRYGRIIDAQ